MRGAAAIALLLLLAGCRVTDAVPDRTGLTLEIQIEDVGNYAVLYRVDRGGTLGFGGGADARDERTTWSGVMSDAEIETLRALLQDHHWLDGGPAAGGPPSERVTRIRLEWPDGRLRTTLRGRSPDVGPVERHLEAIAGRRLDPYLESLPKAETRPDGS